jgi:hypothetical protein
MTRVITIESSWATILTLAALLLVFLVEVQLTVDERSTISSSALPLALALGSDMHSACPFYGSWLTWLLALGILPLHSSPTNKPFSLPLTLTFFLGLVRPSFCIPPHSLPLNEARRSLIFTRRAHGGRARPTP